MFDIFPLQIYINTHLLLVTPLRYFDVYIVYMDDVGNVLYIVEARFDKKAKSHFKGKCWFISNTHYQQGP